MEKTILAINKLDAVSDPASTFRRFEAEFGSRGTCIPISALTGMGVTEREPNWIKWYSGPSLWEAIRSPKPPVSRSFIFQVSNGLFRADQPESRGYAGQVRNGPIRLGQSVYVGSAQQCSTIKKISTFDEPELTEALPGQSVVLSLSDEIDVSRGEMIMGSLHASSKPLGAEILNLSEGTLRAGDVLVLKVGSLTTKCKLEITQGVEPNRFGKLNLLTQREMVKINFEECRELGSFALIHPTMHSVLAVGVFE
jgi:sulfate adenylyltransferase subunit 1 (EFTu-like GTPase family)